MQDEKLTFTLSLDPGEALALNNALTFWRDSLTIKRLKAEMDGQDLTAEHADRELLATKVVHRKMLMAFDDAVHGVPTNVPAPKR
jgi:hypothetical protein